MKQVLLLGTSLLGLCTASVGHSKDSSLTEELSCKTPLVSVASAAYPCLNKWLSDFFATQQCPVELLEPVRTERALRLLEQQQIDFVVGLSETSERRKFARFSKPLTDVNYHFYGATKTSAKPIETLCDDAMQSYHIVAIEGFHVSPEITATFNDRNCYRSLQIESYSGAQLVSMLLAGRADVALIPDAFVAKMASLNETAAAANLFQHPLKLSSDPNRIAFNQQKVPQALVDQINIGLDDAWQARLHQCLYAQPK